MPQAPVALPPGISDQPQAPVALPQGANDQPQAPVAPTPVLSDNTLPTTPAEQQVKAGLPKNEKNSKTGMEQTGGQSPYEDLYKLPAQALDQPVVKPSTKPNQESEREKRKPEIDQAKADEDVEAKLEPENAHKKLELQLIDEQIKARLELIMAEEKSRAEEARLIMEEEMHREAAAKTNTEASVIQCESDDRRALCRREQQLNLRLHAHQTTLKNFKRDATGAGLSDLQSAEERLHGWFKLEYEIARKISLRMQK